MRRHCLHSSGVPRSRLWWQLSSLSLACLRTKKASAFGLKESSRRPTRQTPHRGLSSVACRKTSGSAGLPKRRCCSEAADLERGLAPAAFLLAGFTCGKSRRICCWSFADLLKILAYGTVCSRKPSRFRIQFAPLALSEKMKECTSE